MKKIAILTFLLLITVSLSAQLDTINIGTGANTGTGDPLRTAFIKVNDAVNLLNNTHLYVITGTGDTIATRAYARIVGDNMTYPASGIALSTGSAWGSSITNNSTNWNTAYTDRLKWDGGSTDLVAATGRTSLGATTVGSAFFTLTNPSAITFPRINADNTVTALSAANFKTALSLTASDVGLGNVTNESKATMFTSPAFTGSVPTTGGVAMSRVFSDTMSVSAGVLRTKVTTITTEPYSVQIFSSNGKDITHAVSDSVALDGGVYKLYVYSVDALSGCKLKILY